MEDCFNREWDDQGYTVTRDDLVQFGYAKVKLWMVGYRNNAGNFMMGLKQ